MPHPDRNPPPLTLQAQVALWAEHIRGLLHTLLTAHGAPYDWTRGDDGGNVTIISGTPYAWPPLPVDGERLQSQLVQEYRDFNDLLRVLLAGQSEAALKAFEKDAAALHRLIERKQHPYATATRALERGDAALTRHVDILAGIHSEADARTLIVPDTNALYWNPALETWTVPYANSFTIILTPTVVSELDAHKVDERSSVRRAKAERLVNQIREYRRRGRLVDGVPLVKGVSTIKAIAAEPKMAESLTWLDPSNADDRFLASALEVMRAHTRCRVVVATRDTNLQNKLELARLPFFDPADLVSAAEK